MSIKVPTLLIVEQITILFTFVQPLDEQLLYLILN